MPTINFSLKDLQNLVGKKITLKELECLIQYCKGEIENYDEASDEVTAELGDTNLPYLWSTEGIARLLKSVVGKEKGIPKIKTANSKYEIIVDSSVDAVRPYLVAFAAKGKNMDSCLIEQMIQLQEKLSENFGRKRHKVAIGIYRLEEIKFPVYYKATEPSSVKFIPLDFKKPMTQKEILEEHPKGKEYAYILEGMKRYPILIDSANNVLSFPPIINSSDTGKIEKDDSSIFFEATGTDINALNLVANIFAYALHDRGFGIFSVNIKYKNKSVKTPELKTQTIKLDKKDAERILGLQLKDNEIKKLLEKARYNIKNSLIEIPSYRADILHSIDVIEDIAIMFGYDKIKGLKLTEYTVGRTFEIVDFINSLRDFVIGHGYQEILSPVLCNKETLYDKMNITDFGTIEISNKMSETFSCVRSWLVPVLMDALSKNKHIDYPQKIFEEGIVTVRKGSKAVDYERIAIISAGKNANFTEIKQMLDYLMALIGLEYHVEDTKHESFIDGRVGRVNVRGKEIAYIGEMHPKVLSNFSLEMPVAALEINLTELFQLVKK